MNPWTGREPRLRRERILFAYQDALERGDWERVEALLRDAEADPELEADLWEQHLALGAMETLEAMPPREQQAAVMEQDAATVRTLSEAYFAAPDDAAAALSDNGMPAPLTVSDVAARLRADAAQNALADPMADANVQQLERVREPLPVDLSLRGVRTLLSRVGLGSVGRRFEEIFQETALFLAMGRQQNDLRLAATRRKRELREPRRPATHDNKETQ